MEELVWKKKKLSKLIEFGEKFFIWKSRRKVFLRIILELLNELEAKLKGIFY